MAKKTLEVFNISFIDLLSGALAAVIILFVIVPKMDAKSKEASEKLDALGLEVNELDSLVEELEQSVSAETYEQVIEQIEELKETVEAARESVKDLEQENGELQRKATDSEKYRNWMEKCDLKLENPCPPKDPLTDCPPSYIEYKNWMDNCGFVLNDECPAKTKNAKQVSIGFKFKGDRIVFLIDVSGSMSSLGNAYNEDRLGEVKAGLKMLIASMEGDFLIDVIRFPYITDVGLNPNWGILKPVSDANKHEVYAFLYGLQAGGGTPTRNALEYALMNYPGVSDIVLLSDGEPTNPNRSGGYDDIYDILSRVDELNVNDVQINTIGVGADFFVNPNHDKVIFLKQLSARNDGFFIGF